MSTKIGTARTAYIALGSNVGDRLDMIEKACLALDQDPNIKVTRTSSLYETEPMYVEDQARFLNGACEVGISHGTVWKNTLICENRYKPH
jgi:2-amino-4-hydroxy-6-hydroxymethyldihydropteridine diphosphokinase/dihydropteroate synthase